MVPGWAAIEELGGIDTIELDADDLFTADSVTLEDIRIFKGGRIDRAILYAVSILNQSCETLRGLFSQIIEDRTDILFPVKDLEQHTGLGFSAWCDNNRILIGTRRYMEQEGVCAGAGLRGRPLQKRRAANFVSGGVRQPARYVRAEIWGGAQWPAALPCCKKENIRLLVTCQDPSLTAHHITEAYRLPEGMITVLDRSSATPSRPHRQTRRTPAA